MRFIHFPIQLRGFIYHFEFSFRCLQYCTKLFRKRNLNLPLFRQLLSFRDPNSKCFHRWSFPFLALICQFTISNCISPFSFSEPWFWIRIQLTISNNSWSFWLGYWKPVLLLFVKNQFSFRFSPKIILLLFKRQILHCIHFSLIIFVFQWILLHNFNFKWDHFPKLNLQVRILNLGISRTIFLPILYLISSIVLIPLIQNYFLYLLPHLRICRKGINEKLVPRDCKIPLIHIS